LQKSGIGAIATTRNRSACGFSYEFDTVEDAHEEAMRQCQNKAKGRLCKIIETTSPEFRATSSVCKKRYAEWLRLTGFKAFAVSGSGQFCGWSSMSASSATAVKQAVDFCKTRGKGCRVIYYESGIHREATTSLVRAGQSWLDENQKNLSIAAVRELQQELIAREADCGSISVDGKIGPQTLAAIGRCLSPREQQLTGEKADSLKDLARLERTFRFRTVNAFIDQLEVAGISEIQRSGIERELNRVLGDPQWRVTPKVASVRLSPIKSQAPEDQAIISMSIDLGDGEKVVLYPVKSGQSSRFWSIEPKSREANIQPQTTVKVATVDAKENETARDSSVSPPDEVRIALVIGNNAYDPLEPVHSNW
jgi:hypothetical protein